MIEHTEIEKAYLAGICDSEFYVGWCNGTPTVTLNTTDFNLVDIIAKNYDINSSLKLRKNQIHRNTKEVSLYGNNCRNFLTQVRPYLLVKDRQADIILNKEENPREKLMSLNKRSVNHELRELKDVLWTPERFAYYAGLTDGEGCIFGDYRPRFYYCINMCDPGAINPLALKYSARLGKVDRSEISHRDIYTVKLYSKSMLSFLIEIYSYLQLKKPQAELVLNCGASKEERLAVVAKLRILNKRGTK